MRNKLFKPRGAESGAMIQSLPNETEEDRYLQGKIESWQMHRRAQLGPCGCINTDCILEKMALRQNERKLNATINELRAHLSLKQKDLEAALREGELECEAALKKKRRRNNRAGSGQR